MDKAFYSTTEAAQLFNRDQRTIQRWILEEPSRFPNAQKTTAGYIIPADDIQAELRRRGETEK